MFRLYRTQHHFHHDPKRPHLHHDEGGAVIESHGTGTRKIQVVRKVLDANDMMADRMRTVFADHKVFVMNVMSSPGSGKTTTLIRGLKAIMPALRCAVVVGTSAPPTMPTSWPKAARR
jgi:hydrogenase nickel incorporation protein HypB